MSAIGETLRRERLERKLDLEQISRELKISQKFLEAIEEEQFDKLPGGVFAKSFVRQYARLLGLDEEELAAEVQRIMDPPMTAGEAVAPPPMDIHLPRVEAWQMGSVSERRFAWSSSLPALALVVAVMLVCSGVYSWWQRQRTLAAQHQAPVAESQAPAAVETSQVPPATVPAPVAPPVTPPDANGTPAAGNPPAAVTPAPSEANGAAKPAATAPVPPAVSPVQRAEAPPAASPSNPPAVSEQAQSTPERPRAPNGTPVRVEVTAGETVWVLARADDKYLFSGTMEANQTRMVEANDRVLLRLGNAGGVSITLNGRPIGAVGPKGQVRTVQFTSGGFQIVAAPKPSLPLEDIF